MKFISDIGSEVEINTEEEVEAPQVVKYELESVWRIHHQIGFAAKKVEKMLRLDKETNYIKIE